MLSVNVRRVLDVASSVQASRATTRNTTDENLGLESSPAGVNTLSQDTDPTPTAVPTLSH